MGILDKIGFGKKQEKPEEKKVKEPAREKQAETAAQKAESKPEQKKKPAHATRQGAPRASAPHRYLVRPILSEKATMLAGRGKYMFEVTLDANKQEVKKSIETVYKVGVEDVNIVKMSGKKRRYGKSVGKTSDWKKAIITVKAGQKIPGFVESVG